MIAFAPLAQRQSELAVKICGVRLAEHALAAHEAGAALLGFLFAPSKRRVSPEEARGILQELRAQGQQLQAVGVFVNEAPPVMAEIAAQCGLAALQLSGDEPPALLDALELPVIVTIRLLDDERERGWMALARQHPERVLLHVDAHVAGSYGGAGVVADWDRAAALARELPFLLAGGLSPENVAAALAAVRPFGVDVSSGVETDGVKDTRKIQRFLQAACGHVAQG